MGQIMAIKWDAAAIIAGLVAIVGGAVWLGNLQSDINNLDIETIRAEIADAKQSNSLLPTGAVIMFWGDEFPAGYEVCDGSLIQDRDSKLYNQNKPDFENRFPLLQATIGNHKIGGASKIVLDVENLPPHSHPNPGIGRGDEKIEKKDNYRKNYLQQVERHKANETFNSGPSSNMKSKEISIMPPFQSVTCLIKVR